jgi:single-strand DNA-binding protein
MLNSCVLVGNLGGDPKFYYSTAGLPVASFSLAFNSNKEKTGWIKIVCFGRLAEVANEYLSKGARIGVAGSLDQQQWQSEEGYSKSAFRLLANAIEFIKIDQETEEEEENEHENAPEKVNAEEEEIPF